MKFVPSGKQVPGESPLAFTPGPSVLGTPLTRLLARASAVHKDPTNLFPEANTLGTALMDKVDPASPTYVCLDKDDGEKYLLYVTTRMMKALHMIAQAVELETRGVVHIEGTDLSAEERKQDLRDNLRRPIYVGFGQRSTHVFSADGKIYNVN